MIKAILYDLDGVLVDACEWHYIAFNNALKKVTTTFISRDEHENVFNGLPTKEKLNKLLAQKRIKQSDVQEIWNLKQKFTTETIFENGKLDHNKIDLHKTMKCSDMKIACVTNSINETAKSMLKVTGQLEFIDLLISNEMVKNHKPHGEGYIKAMIHFNIMPENVLIVEDSPVGLQAANSTGANVMAVNNCQEVTVESVTRFIKNLR